MLWNRGCFSPETETHRAIGDPLVTVNSLQAHQKKTQGFPYRCVAALALVAALRNVSRAMRMPSPEVGCQ